MANRRVRIFISGKVQGVFFRQALKVMAIKTGVSGWVRNLDDGRVEAVLEGRKKDVDKLVEWSHGGPANARVLQVTICAEEFSSEFSKFEVLY